MTAGTERGQPRAPVPPRTSVPAARPTEEAASR